MFDEDKPKELSVYADSNNLWEAICAGFNECIAALSLDAHLDPGIAVNSRFTRGYL